jgi:hypothetical protein
LKKDSQRCDQYNGSGAIALISYIFAFFAVIVIIKNIAGNVLPVLNGPVFGLIILSGIFGLIATCMFGDLYGHENYPFGYHFGLFTTAWVLLLFVGLTGMSDFRKNVRPSETTSAIRAGLLVIALTAFAFSMGNNWYNHDQQELLAPLGGRDWTIKSQTFFIEPYTELGQWSSTREVIAENFRNLNHKDGIVYCNDTDYDVPSEDGGDDGGDSLMRKKNNNNKKDKKTCYSSPDVSIVTGFVEIGLWNTCYCKNTLSLECSIFGSDFIMFNNKQKKCDTFNVARAMVLMVGILSLGALVLSSALLGGLRKVNLHLLSNTLCLLTSVLGLISTILYGVLYEVDDLGRDFAIYLAGWWLVFLAAVLGAPVTSYYTEVQNAGQIQPTQPLVVAQ